jgi:hypothetical protein
MTASVVSPFTSQMMSQVAAHNSSSRPDFVPLPQANRIKPATSDDDEILDKKARK